MIRSYASLLFWLGMTIAASLMLYHTSDRVNDLDQQLRGLNAQIEAERQSMHVLKAEWVYLANPARIEAEAARHLDLRPTAPQRVAALQSMGDLLPLRDGVAPMPPIQTAQLAQAPALPETKSAPIPHGKPSRIASLDGRHINDHMLMPHTVAVEASTDRIGALIGTLGMHP